MDRFQEPLNLTRGGSFVTSVFWRYSGQDYTITAGWVTLLALFFVWWSDAVAHWFVLPIAACGVLVGVDITRWLRRGLDLYDPKTIIAFLAFYGFCVAPLLNVVWDTFGVGDLLLWGDWRPWLGAMAALNAAGLVAYRWAEKWAYSKTSPAAIRWEIDRQKFYPVFALALTLSALGVFAYLWQLGGIVGEVEAYETNQAAFVGKGWLLTLAWPLAVLSFLVFVYASRDPDRKNQRRLVTALLILGVAGIGHFVLMGWYGSRSATIWALFWMAGIVHYYFRKIPGYVTAIGALLLIGFMYFYGFYKERGRAGLEVLRSPTTWLTPSGYQRNVRYLLLGDLARADCNASLLHNLMKDPGDYDYRWGLTYLGALTILIPKSLWLDRPDIRVDAGTEALWGKASPWRSSRLYGLSGEALLNFGFWGVAPVFAVYGGLLGWYRRKLLSWEGSDARIFLAPFLTSIAVRALVYDSDNLVFAVVTQGMLVCVAILAASKRCLVTRQR